MTHFGRRSRCRNLDDLPNRSCPPCYLQHGRVYTNHLNPDTAHDFAGALASYWTSACIDDDPGFESYLHLYASHVRWSPGCVDPLLRKVADDVIANVLLADTDLGWLYHPYDGGMDVIMSPRTERDMLRDRHRDWLSAHPGGL